MVVDAVESKGLVWSAVEAKGGLKGVHGRARASARRQGATVASAVVPTPSRGHGVPRPIRLRTVFAALPPGGDSTCGRSTERAGSGRRSHPERTTSMGCEHQRGQDGLPGPARHPAEAPGDSLVSIGKIVLIGVVDRAEIWDAEAWAAVERATDEGVNEGTVAVTRSQCVHTTSKTGQGAPDIRRLRGNTTDLTNHDMTTTRGEQHSAGGGACDCSTRFWAVFRPTRWKAPTPPACHLARSGRNPDVRPLAGRLPESEICHRPKDRSLGPTWVPPRTGGCHSCQPPVAVLS